MVNVFVKSKLHELIVHTAYDEIMKVKFEFMWSRCRYRELSCAGIGADVRICNGNVIGVFVIVNFCKEQLTR